MKMYQFLNSRLHLFYEMANKLLIKEKNNEIMKEINKKKYRIKE